MPSYKEVIEHYGNLYGPPPQPDAATLAGIAEVLVKLLLVVKDDPGAMGGSIAHALRAAYSMGRPRQQQEGG